MILDLEGKGKRDKERWGEVFETIRTQEDLVDPSLQSGSCWTPPGFWDLSFQLWTEGVSIASFPTTTKAVAAAGMQSGGPDGQETGPGDSSRLCFCRVGL